MSLPTVSQPVVSQSASTVNHDDNDGFLTLQDSEDNKSQDSEDDESSATDFLTDTELIALTKDFEDYETKYYEQDDIQLACEEIDLSGDVEDYIVIITKAAIPITVDTVDYVHVLPSYPKTHPKGHAYLVDLQAAK